MGGMCNSNTYNCLVLVSDHTTTLADALYELVTDLGVDALITNDMQTIITDLVKMRRLRMQRVPLRNCKSDKSTKPRVLDAIIKEDGSV